MAESSTAEPEIKRREQRKLEALLGLCETTSCRRITLLNYFGESYEKPCQNCDTCLNPSASFDATLPVKMALSAIYRTGQRFGVAHLIDVLLGKETDKIFGFGHHKLSVFGVGKEYKAESWRSIFRQLIAMGIIKVEMESFGSLKLTKESGPILRGEKELWLRATKSGKNKTTKTKVAHRPETDLFNRLRALRLALAKEHGVPPYVIFHDRTLFEISESRPKTLEEMGELNGVGVQKLAKYGEKFLEALRA